MGHCYTAYTDRRRRPARAKSIGFLLLYELVRAHIIMDDDLQFSLDDIDAMMGQGANADENVQLSVEKEAEEEEPEEEEEDEEDEELEDEMEEDEEEVCAAVPKQNQFSQSHVKRLVAQHSWYRYDRMTGASSCAACPCSRSPRSASRHGRRLWRSTASRAARASRSSTQSAGSRVLGRRRRL